MSATQDTAPIIPLERLKEDHWTEQEAKNVAVVVDFFQHLMNEHDFDYTIRNFGQESYVQHNRAIPPEISGVVGYVKALTKRFPDYSYDVKRIVSSGDIVVLHSHITLRAAHRGNERKGFIVTDTFRLENGKLREHWDAMQAIDLLARFLMLFSGGAIANDNSTF